MDLTRGLCILLVLCGHSEAAMQLNFRDVPTWFSLLNDAFQPFRMPLLMFLSGTLLHKGLVKSDKVFLSGKFSQIFWPFLLWSMIIYAAEGRLTVEYILKTPISAPSLLWYLWFLSAYYVISLGLDRYRIPLLPVIILSMAASGVLPDFLRMARFAFLLSFFLLGHLVATRNLSMNGRAPLAIVGMAGALAGAVANVLYGNILYDPLFVWVPLGLIAFTLWAAPNYQGGGAGRVVEWVGRNSIVFYVSHFPLQLMVVQHAGTLKIGSDYAVWVLAMSVSLAGGAILQLLRARYDIFAALFDFRRCAALPRGLATARGGKRVQVSDDAR